MLARRVDGVPARSSGRTCRALPPTRDMTIDQRPGRARRDNCELNCKARGVHVRGPDHDNAELCSSAETCEAIPGC